MTEIKDLKLQQGKDEETIIRLMEKIAKIQ